MNFRISVLADLQRIGADGGSLMQMALTPQCDGPSKISLLWNVWTLLGHNVTGQHYFHSNLCLSIGSTLLNIAAQADDVMEREPRGTQ